MQSYKILCDIGNEIYFNIAGKTIKVSSEDLINEENLKRIYRIQFNKAPLLFLLDLAISVIKRNPEIELRFYGNYSEDLIDWDKLHDVEKLSIDL